MTLNFFLIENPFQWMGLICIGFIIWWVEWELTLGEGPSFWAIKEAVRWIF